MLTSKEFDEKLQLKNFEQLEKEYQKTKKFFQQTNDKFKCDDIELNFPAFCYFDRSLIIKFPTYKVRVINNEMTYEELNELLKDTGNYKIYEEPNVVTLPKLETVKSIAVHCLENNLDENTCTAEKIEMKFCEKGIKTQRCVTYGYYVLPIKIDEERYFIVDKI